MTFETIRRFTCDRCGVVEETGSTKQAARWVRLMIAEPVLSADPTWDFHLCEACSLDVHKAVGTPEFLERFRTGGSDEPR